IRVIQPFSPQQCAHFTIPTLSRCSDDLALVGGREPSPCGAWLHLRGWILAVACRHLALSFSPPTFYSKLLVGVVASILAQWGDGSPYARRINSGCLSDGPAHSLASAGLAASFR